VKPWTVSNGELHITAAPASADIQSQINGYQYTSGMINSYHSFSQEYGYFEMKAELPAGQGLWPAFWLMPTDGSWPPELDIMEVLGQDPTTLHTSVHTNETGEHTYATQANSVADTSSGMHTYGVDWEADKITFYYDGKEVYETATPSDMHKPMYMIANLAVGGSWPGSPDGSTQFPATMDVDYIRAWDSNPYTNGGTIPDGSETGSTGSTDGSTGDSTGASAPAASNLVTGQASADVLSGQADVGNRIRGWNGDDSITGGNQFNDINGNKGHDTIVGHSTVGDWLMGGQAGDLIDTTQSTAHNLVNGNMGDDKLMGGSGGDVLRGGQGADTIVGGADGDWISGDRGYNTVSGGGGADVFHGSANGVTTVTDFNAGEGDRVHVYGGVEHNATQVDGDVHVSIGGGGELILQNTQLSSLQSGWIFS
jgi:Ca2+-binding RTX toxin-like protein